MTNATQLLLLDLGPALVASDRGAALVAGIREKIDADAALGLLGGEDFEPDFSDA